MPRIGVWLFMWGLSWLAVLRICNLPPVSTLFAAFQRFDYDYVCAILISIIALIMIGEVLATAVRAIFIDNATLLDMLRRGGAMPHERHLEDD